MMLTRFLFEKIDRTYADSLQQVLASGDSPEKMLAEIMRAIRAMPEEEQQVILQRPLDEWIDQQDASLWHAEERGIVEMELTPEQMAQVLAEPKPKEVKP